MASASTSEGDDDAARLHYLQHRYDGNADQDQFNNLDSNAPRQGDATESNTNNNSSTDGDNHASEQENDDDAVIDDGLGAWRAMLNNNKIFTPKFVLVLFTILNCLTFVDRGCLSGALIAIREDHDMAKGPGHPLAESDAALLASVFMASFSITAPIATSSRLPTRTILLISLSIWAASLFLTAFSTSFAMLLTARAFDGVAEAANSPYIVVLIEMIAPPDKKNLWIGVYMTQLACGTAAGVIFGSVMANSGIGAGSFLSGWRVAFLIVGVLVVLLTIVFWFLPKEYSTHQHAGDEENEDEEEEEENRGRDAESAAGGAENSNSNDGGDEKNDVEQLQLERQVSSSTTAVASSSGADRLRIRHVGVKEAVCRLLSNCTFVLLAAAITAYDFFVSAAAVYVVTMARQAFPIRANVAAMATGLTMMGTGILGSLFGGGVTDKLTRNLPALEGQWKSVAILIAFVAVSLPATLAALLATTSVLFFPMFAIGVFLLVGLHPTLTASIMRCVAPELRPWSQSISLFVMHVAGDAISPLITAALSTDFNGHCGDSTNFTVCLGVLASVTFNNSNSSSSISSTTVSNSSSNTSAPLPLPDFYTARSAAGCRWMPSDDKKLGVSYCVHTRALNYAMLVVAIIAFVGLFLTLIFACLRLKHEAEGNRTACCSPDDDDEISHAYGGGGNGTTSAASRRRKVTSEDQELDEVLIAAT